MYTSRLKKGGQAVKRKQSLTTRLRTSERHQQSRFARTDKSACTVTKRCVSPTWKDKRQTITHNNQVNKQTNKQTKHGCKTTIKTDKIKNISLQNCQKRNYRE